MTKDYSQVIGTLRETAIGRCRQRIDAAAKKMQKMVGNPPEEKKDKVPPCTEQYGVTSVLKKRHGL